jgi:hypothetical protein
MQVGYPTSIEMDVFVRVDECSFLIHVCVVVKRTRGLEDDREDCLVTVISFFCG